MEHAWKNFQQVSDCFRFAQPFASTPVFWDNLYQTHETTLAAKMSAPGTVFILWPLLLCVNKPYLPTNQNEWILGRIRLICDLWNLEKGAEAGITLENYLDSFIQPKAWNGIGE